MAQLVQVLEEMAILPKGIYRFIAAPMQSLTERKPTTLKFIVELKRLQRAKVILNSVAIDTTIPDAKLDSRAIIINSMVLAQKQTCRSMQ